MRQQDKTVRGYPFEYRRVGRGRQINVANVSEFQARIAPGQAVDDVLIEVLVDQKRDQGINPFALARVNSSSLLTPGPCAASISRRTAVACSSQRRR